MVYCYKIHFDQLMPIGERLQDGLTRLTGYIPAGVSMSVDSAHTACHYAHVTSMHMSLYTWCSGITVYRVLDSITPA